MSEETIPDGLLLRRYREGRDEAAFAELRRRHGRLVLATCRRETGDPALAEDAVQGVFLLLIRKSFDDHASLAGWLHGASRLVSRNLVREEDRRRRRERRAFEEFGEPDGPTWNAVSPHIDAALAALAAGDREAVLLRFANDQGLVEVGRSLGIGENAARMRVSRALERMRIHLRRAGVGVGVLVLASLLSTRLADAEPLELAPPSDRARRLARPRMIPFSMPTIPGAFGIVVLGGLVLKVGMAGPPRLSPAKAAGVFRSVQGGWAGILEFADDATGVRTKTPTTVDVRREGGGLRLEVRYPRFSNVDTTTIVPQDGGRYRIENGGPGSSHRLDGLYDFIWGSDGSPTFAGFSPAAHGEIRLTLRLSERSLFLEEDRRRGDRFALRNRFELTRAP